MQTDILRTTPRVWDFLEPAMHPDQARTDHVVLLAPSAGNYTSYLAGQILRQKNDGSNVFAKVGVGGYGGPPRINKYPLLLDSNGKFIRTTLATWQPNMDVFEGSIAAYYQGFFKTQDLIGAGGTNEVQTETLDGGVDGGTRTLSFMGYTTAPIAWDANAAAIKAAMLLAIPVLTTADITVAGSYTYTFSGNYAGANVPLIVVDPTLLTDGGVAPATTGSVIVETTPGAGLLTGIGRLFRGTSSSGIMELGAATPV